MTTQTPAKASRKPRARSQGQPRSKRSTTRAKPAPARGWQQHKPATTARRQRALQAATRGWKTTRTKTRTYRRKARRRGTMFAILGTAVAAVALTLAVTELLAVTTSIELGLAAEGIAGLTSWILGEPTPPEEKRRRGRAPGQGYVAGGKCGRSCADGTPCENNKRAGASGCYLHGGGGGPTPNTTPKSKPRKPRGKPNDGSTSNGLPPSPKPTTP